MKRFPITTIPIPIKPRSNTLLLNLKIFTKSINHLFKRGTTLRILGYQVSPLVPADPFGGRVGFLKGGHFFDQGVVEGPVGFCAE